MATMNTTGQAAPIYYFDFEGRRNLDQVLRIVKKVLKKREELRHLKIVFFTAEGHGRALAYNRLREFRPKIIAVTFPPHFSVKVPNSEERYFPKISDDVRGFFSGVRIDVVIPLWLAKIAICR